MGPKRPRLGPKKESRHMIERIETTARASKIVKHRGVAYLSGQVGEGATIQDQTIETLRRVDALLTQAGSSREQMLRATIWLADMSDFAGLNEVWNAWVFNLRHLSSPNAPKIFDFRQR